MALRCALRPLLLQSTPRVASAQRTLMRHAVVAPMRAFASSASSAASSTSAAATPAAAAESTPFDARMQFTRQPLDRDGEPTGPPELYRTDAPLDPRHFRLPNESFIMVRVHPVAGIKYSKKVVGGPESRRNTRGAPVPKSDVPREKDPHLVAFRVPLNYNKLQIRNYLEEIYKVDIVEVHTMIYLGKERRNRRTGKLEKRSDYKKAYVRLVHPFPYPTLEEQRKMGATGYQPVAVTPAAGPTAEESAAVAAREAERQAREQADLARKEHIRKQVADNLAKAKEAQAARIRGAGPNA